MLRTLCAILAALSGLAISRGAAAEIYPKINPDSAFPELKIYDAHGKPYRAAKEDWEAARRRVTDDPAWRQWLLEERAEVDRWISKHHDRVDWIAGWSNDFVSPKDGSRIIWDERIPGEEVDHFHSPSDRRIPITDKLTAAWVRIWRERHVGMMERAARLYRLTGEEAYAKWAAGQLDFYAEHYLEWEPQRQGARLFWQSLTEGVNLITFAHTVRLLDDYVTESRRQLWFDEFFLPEVNVLKDSFPRILNITCWLRAAAAQVALVFGDESMWREAIDGPFGVRQQVAEGITSDYLWYEQSFSYNSYVVRAFTSLFETAGIYGREDELRLEMATIENLMLATVYLRFPTGELPVPSDTKGQLFAPDEELFAENYRVFPTTIGLAKAQGLYNWNTLLDPPPLPGEHDGLPLVTSRNFESSRMAVLKDGPWQVFIHYGQPPIKSHLQAEVLNFSAFYKDVDVTHDPGTVGYGSPLHRNYYTRGLNHNVPLIDGEGQEQPPKGRRPDPFTKTRAGELLEFSVEPARISVAHPVYRRDAQAERTISIDGDRLRDVVKIRSNSGKPAKLGLVLHLQGKVQLPRNFTEDSLIASNRPASFHYWSQVQRATFKDEASFDVDYGDVVMRVTFKVPGDVAVWHASTPDRPPHRREAIYLEQEGNAVVIETIISPRNDSERRSANR